MAVDHKQLFLLIPGVFLASSSEFVRLKSLKKTRVPGVETFHFIVVYSKSYMSRNWAADTLNFLSWF